MRFRFRCVITWLYHGMYTRKPLWCLSILQSKSRMKEHASAFALSRDLRFAKTMCEFWLAAVCRRTCARKIRSAMRLGDL